MALVAFDLDNTLGYFNHVGVWADFFSIDTLENEFNAILNPKFKIPRHLKILMRRAEAIYARKILDSPRILHSVLRTNLDAMILPLIKAKRAGKVRAICIYSNTWNTFTVHLGKVLIEAVYNARGLFDCVIDASHAVRLGDWGIHMQGDQKKTLPVLKCIFKEICKVKGPVRPSDILFVDERKKKHDLMNQEKDGLTYLKPTEYLPKISQELMSEVFNIGLEALKESGLMDSKEYMKFDIFNCVKYGDFDKENEFIIVSDFQELIDITHENLKRCNKGHIFIDDGRRIRDVIHKFLQKF